MKWDALIIGGGPAGSTAACLLARKGWRVALLESKAFPRQKVCGEYLSAANRLLIESLGIAEDYDAQAGPEVRQVGLFAGSRSVVAPLAAPKNQRHPKWGRALGRDILDTMLLRHAQSAGAEIFQPCVAEHLELINGGVLCRTKMLKNGEQTEFEARVAIAAHGSWEPGNLLTQHSPPVPRPGHLFGFKAHLTNAELPDGLMPLLAFPAGYGGLVHSQNGRVSLSCCVRRDMLVRLPRTPSGMAGDAVLAHICETCPAARAVLQHAQLADRWLSSGPIRPGIRPMYRDGIFRIGNAAGEAHPVVAEGIGMAMQSAWLLAESLPDQPASFDEDARQWASREYTRRWHQTFVSRIRAARLFANLAMRPLLSNFAAASIQCFPSVLTLCAAWSGKAALPFSIREVGYQV